MSPRLETGRDERDEAQDEPRARGQGVRAALLALAVAGLVGGSWWAGHRSAPATQDGGAVPEIHPDAAPVKEAPKEPGGLVVPGQDSVLLNRDAKGDAKTKPEELLPPAETVKLRPAPPEAPPESAANAPTPPAGLSTPPLNAAPQATSPAPTITPPMAPQVAINPPAAVTPPLVTAPKAATSIAGSFRLQLGALKTEEAAKSEWLKLQRQNSDVLGKLSLSVSRVALGAKGTYYRIQAGPIADEAKAAQDCAALKSRKIACILVKP